MSLTEKLKNMEYKYIVQIHSVQNDEWIDYAKFKELEAAKEYAKYYVIKAVIESDNNVSDITSLKSLWRIVEE